MDTNNLAQGGENQAQVWVTRGGIITRQETRRLECDTSHITKSPLLKNVPHVKNEVKCPYFKISSLSINVLKFCI